MLATSHETSRFRSCLDLVSVLYKDYTPKHGSWLNIAEIELSAINSQCLNRRIPDIETMRNQISACQKERNKRGAPINWLFKTEDARVKLLRLYPKL